MPKPLLTLSYEQLKTDLLSLAASVGDEYAYKAPPEAGCQYFDKNGKPGCIIGHVLAIHGVQREDLERFKRPNTPLSYEDGNLPTWPNESNVSTLVRVNALAFTDEVAKDLAISAQQQQDAGIPWSDAVPDAILRTQPNKDTA